MLWSINQVLAGRRYETLQEVFIRAAILEGSIALYDCQNRSFDFG